MSEIAENVNKFIEEAARMVGNHKRDDFLLLAEDLSSEHCNIKSPIEQILYTALLTVMNINGKEELESDEEFSVEDECRMMISPQESIGKYRADFVIKYVHMGQIVSFIVECDGHAFHDKNERQRRYEKQRDRFFQRKGYKVLHFTGAEIIQNPFKVACEILSEASAGIRPNFMIDAILEYVPNMKQREELKKMYEPAPKGSLL